MEKYAAVILAAGKGTRMNEGQASPIPKVMFPILGKPIIDWSVKLVRDAGINRIVLVVGYKKEMIKDHFGQDPQATLEYAVQEEQLGTGHAVAQAKLLLGNQTEATLVFYGDCPLYKPETVHQLISLYEREQPAIAMLTAISEDPTGYGRVFRNQNGDVTDIIEHKDCDAEQLKNKEWNPGFYIFRSSWLWENIDDLSNDNMQKEYYLTDLIQMAKAQGERIVAIPVSEENEALGINTQEQLKEAEEVLKLREQISN